VYLNQFGLKKIEVQNKIAYKRDGSPINTRTGAAINEANNALNKSNGNHIEKQCTYLTKVFPEGMTFASKDIFLIA
jgi:hypothetical protein